MGDDFMTFLSKLARGLELLQTKGAAHALATWPKFSLASFSIIERMKQAGVTPRTIIDVGANVGQFAVAASRLFEGAEIYPVEPDPRIADVLRRNIGQKVAANVLVTAVGDRPGEATFHVNRDPQVSSLLPLGADRIASFPTSKVTEAITVPVATLDSLFQGRPLQKPILLKIDVQGFEDRVIMGATNFLARVDWVLMEVSFASLYEGERDFEGLMDLMKSVGFQFVRPMNFHLSPKTGEIIEMDALFKRVISGAD